MVEAAYEASMASALRAYKSDKLIFFYTWAPNLNLHNILY